MKKDVRDALNWFLQETVELENDEEITVMKFINGDLENRTDFSVILIAEFLAKYADHLTK